MWIEHECDTNRLNSSIAELRTKLSHDFILCVCMWIFLCVYSVYTSSVCARQIGNQEQANENREKKSTHWKSRLAWACIDSIVHVCGTYCDVRFYSRWALNQCQYVHIHSNHAIQFNRCACVWLQLHRIPRSEPNFPIALFHLNISIRCMMAAIQVYGCSH